MSNNIILDSDIPTSYTTSPDRPFESIGVRDQYIDKYNVPNKELTDKERQNMPKDNNPNERIDKMTNEANEKSEAAFQERKIYNLSIQEIGFRISDTWHDLIDDVTSFNLLRDGYRGIIEIFVKDDRLIYLGITLMIFTIAALFIRAV
jgi:hypothetical protein